MSAVWTKPYYGITYLGELADRRRCTVIENCKGFVELHKWYEGCAFHPIEEIYESVELAKAEGERWINEIKRPALTYTRQ